MGLTSLDRISPFKSSSPLLSFVCTTKKSFPHIINDILDKVHEVNEMWYDYEAAKGDLVNLGGINATTSGSHLPPADRAIRRLKDRIRIHIMYRSPHSSFPVMGELLHRSFLWCVEALAGGAVASPIQKRFVMKASRGSTEEAAHALTKFKDMLLDKGYEVNEAKAADAARRLSAIHAAADPPGGHPVRHAESRRRADLFRCESFEHDCGG